MFALPNRNRLNCLASAILLCGFCAPVLAQQASTLQDNEQRLKRYYEQQQRAQEAAEAQEPVERPDMGQLPAANVPADLQFRLQGVRFTPSALLPEAELQATVAPWVGTEVDADALRRMLDAVNALYVQREITTARALIGKQTVEGGILQVELVEGRLGSLRVEGAELTDDDFVTRRVHLAQNEVVDSGRLRRDLMRLNRTTSLQVRAQLQPGAARGQTDVLLNIVEPGRWGLDAFVDNNGLDSTGRERVGINGNVYGLLGRDDALQANLSYARGGVDGAVGYSIPVTPGNGRLAVNASRSQINIIKGPFAAIDVVGDSTVYGLEFNQPLFVNERWLVSGIASYSLGDSTTEISGQKVADTRTRLATIGFSGQRMSAGRQWGFTQLYTRTSSDEPILGKTDFRTMPGSAFYLQRLGQSRWVFRGNLGWQFSQGDNMPSANLFQIGGLGSVRGYERGVISGPRGYYGSLELHRLMSEKLDVFAFADHGEIRGLYPQSLSISGAGLGAYYKPWKSLSTSADIAKPLDDITPGQDSFRFNLRVTYHWR